MSNKSNKHQIHPPSIKTETDRHPILKGKFSDLIKLASQPLQSSGKTKESQDSAFHTSKQIRQRKAGDT